MNGGGGRRRGMIMGEEDYWYTTADGIV
jgi:hypothetical protein